LLIGWIVHLFRPLENVLNQHLFAGLQLRFLFFKHHQSSPVTFKLIVLFHQVFYHVAPLSPPQYQMKPKPISSF